MTEGIEPINLNRVHHLVSVQELKKIKPEENLPNLEELYPDEDLSTKSFDEKYDEQKIQRVKTLLEAERTRLNRIYFEAEMVSEKYRATNDPTVLKKLEADWARLTNGCKIAQNRIFALGNALNINNSTVANIQGQEDGLGINEGETIYLGDLDEIPDLKDLFPKEGFQKVKEIDKSEREMMKQRAQLLMNAEGKVLNGLYFRAGNVAKAYKNCENSDEKADLKVKWDMINEKCEASKLKMAALKEFIEKKC